MYRQGSRRLPPDRPQVLIRVYRESSMSKEKCLECPKEINGHSHHEYEDGKTCSGSCTKKHEEKLRAERYRPPKEAQQQVV